MKTGTCNYCKASIVDDLNNKYILDYFCKSVFYIADKADRSSSLSEILFQINKICFDSKKFNWNDDSKKKALIKLIKDKDIKIKIPCLLAYTGNIYIDNKSLERKINDCVQNMVKEFDKVDFQIAQDLEYELTFCIFPLSDVRDLRNKIVEFKKVGV